MKNTALLSLLTLVLAACGGSSGPPAPPPADTLLTQANAWAGDFPQDAEMVSADDFRAGLASGDFTLVSAASLAAQKAAREKQYQDDKTFLQGVGDKSPYLQALLAEAANTPSMDTDRPVALPGSGGQKVLLLGLGTQLRDAAQAYTRSQDVGNALDDYTAAYTLLPDDLRAQADTPESLAGASLAQVQAAAAKLDGLLSALPDLDGSRPDTGASAGPGAGGLQPQAVNAGNGTDNNGPCTPKELVKSYWFPLKNFVSPIKNQASRGTCWAFAAIGAVESRERVQNDNAANLSEQFLVNKVKQDWDSSDDEDGYWSDKALETAVSKGQVFPSEGAWTYNPASSRAYPKYDNTCVGYSGDCSDTAHESRRVCTTFIFKFCSYVAVRYSGAGVASSRTTQLWANGQTFNLNSYRLLLSQGYTLLADFPVYVGVMDRAANGYVTDYSQTKIDDKGNEVAGSYGGHAVQLVGFLSNDTLSKYGQVSKVGGGGYFILKNSWGCNAGDAGYYYVPADYVQKFFGSLRVLNFDGRRSDAWAKEQANPGGSVAPKIVVKTNPARLDLRVETDLAQFFSVSHPVAKSVTLTVTSSTLGTLYNGPWSTDTGALFGPSLKYTFPATGTQTLNLIAKYGQSQATASFVVNVVNTAPKLTLSYSGNPAQGEAYPVSAQITDINEADASKLCADTTWAVDAPDMLSATTGCTVSVKFGAQGARTLRVSTHDTEGLTDVQTVTLNVQPPPVNPYPRIKTSGVYSSEYVGGGPGTIRFCGSVAVPAGNTIDLRQSGCSLSIGGTPLRYSASADVENPSGETLTYDWRLYVTYPSGETNLISSLASKTPSFSLYSPGNALESTYNCRVTLKINAPDPSRSKGPVTVWTGRCTYYNTRIN